MAKKYAHMLTAVGFVDVCEVPVRLPIGPWHADLTQKKMGNLGRANALDGLEGFSTKILQAGLGLPVEEVRRLVAALKRDFQDDEMRVCAGW